MVNKSDYRENYLDTWN